VSAAPADVYRERWQGWVEVSARVRLASLIGIAGCAIAALSGCGSDDGGTVVPPSSASLSSATSAVVGQNGADEGGDVDFDAKIGDCVTLSGTMLDANIDHAVCGSNEANYKVVAKAPTQDGCASDVDQTYYVTVAGREQGALCLDIDWVPGECMTIPTGNDSPTHSPCTPGKPDTVKVLEILTATTDENQCPDSTTQYFSYDERKLVVCVAEV
jgi:hypothetical protein